MSKLSPRLNTPLNVTEVPRKGRPKVNRSPRLNCFLERLLVALTKKKSLAQGTLKNYERHIA
jgi:uncharacterized protein YueI